MGNYNPDAPRIIGQQWVPIRDEDVVFSPAVNVFELGHTFTPSSNYVLQDGRFYIHEFPPQEVQDQTNLISVYKTGTEDLSGPIRSVIIPCNGAAITGGSMSVGLEPSGLATATSIPLALMNPSDNSYFAAQPSGDASQKSIDLYFATSQYAQLLAGKRIVKVQLVHALSWDPNLEGTTTVADDPPLFDLPQNLSIFTSGVPTSSGNLARYAPLVEYFGDDLNAMGIPTGRPPQIALTSRSFGEINQLWPTPSNSIVTGRMPWRYEELARFEKTAGVNRYSVRYEFGASSDSTRWLGTYYLGYAVLQVFFCEEQRVAYGGGSFGSGPYIAGTAGFTGKAYVLGMNPVTMYDTSFNTNPVLLANQQYTVTVSAPDIGDLNGPIAMGTTQDASANAYPTLNGLREVKTNPVNTGVQVNLTQTVGETFSKQTTHILPQISLHTSGGPLVEVHVYGRQAVAEVYGTVTATQEILDSAAGGAAAFPQVRFFARRFGSTTVSLTLSSPTITGAGRSVTISPSEFDALDEIIDGWKQVDLRFAATVTMGAGTTPQWVWSAAGELAGNRWEILGATAPAVSGVVGNNFNLVPSPHQLSSATYGQPSAGATVNMGWMPQYAPPVSGTADDQTSDAVLMFSQDMPVVTNFSLANTSQALTGIGLNCGISPAFIPNAISYNRITWTATSSSIPVSGFGYYELQRMDTLTDWQTIMLATSPTVSGFSDFEARVGLLNSYRIRAVNSFLFAGPWSTTITFITPAPGIVGTGMGVDDHVLIFTSNSRQNGSRNLAYSLAWESQPNEAFTFPEAGFTQLQTMYNRDFFVAFRPTERGGEQFQRTILVQAAAISPETLADFTSLRDMAWDSLPYVCIRDEDGNRWFASVQVPSARVLRDRKLYLADIGVVEVTSTASPVTVTS